MPGYLAQRVHAGPLAGLQRCEPPHLPLVVSSIALANSISISIAHGYDSGIDAAAAEHAPRQRASHRHGR
jgi:hypothetical protein